MSQVMHAAVGALALWLALASHARAHAVPTALAFDRPCQMADEDERWLRKALANWDVARQRFLKAKARSVGPIVTFDNRCSYTIARGAKLRPRWIAAPHQGQVALPNGVQIPAGPNASNAANNGRNFVVFSLPSVWRSVAPKSEIPLELFLEAILLHELAHAYQSVVSPSLSFPALHARRSLPANVSDDSVQDKFKSNPAYVRAYEAERDLLFQAAATSTRSEASSLACDTLSRFRQRRSRHFRGADSVWSEVDELSLTTEGLGEWVSYTWLTRARGLPTRLVLPRFRGRSWSQEHGLALFLVVDRLVPGWQKLLLRRQPLTAEALLGRACAARS